MLLSLLAAALSLAGSSLALPAHESEVKSDPCVTTSCFPALDFKMPDSTPETTTGWWCDVGSEYGFVGISYEVTNCQPTDCHSDASEADYM